MLSLKVFLRISTMTDEGVQVTEESSLLPGVQADAAPATKHARRIVTLLIIVLFLLCTALISFLIPQLRIIENILCHKYYGDSWSTGEIDEKLCKVDEIQSELAYIMGITSMLESIPGRFHVMNCFEGVSLTSIRSVILDTLRTTI